MVCHMPKASRTLGAGLLKRTKLFQNPALESLFLPTNLIDPIPVSKTCGFFASFTLISCLPMEAIVEQNGCFLTRRVMKS